MATEAERQAMAAAMPKKPAPYSDEQLASAREAAPPTGLAAKLAIQRLEDAAQEVKKKEQFERNKAAAARRLVDRPAGKKIPIPELPPQPRPRGTIQQQQVLPDIPAKIQQYEQPEARPVPPAVPQYVSVPITTGTPVVEMLKQVLTVSRAPGHAFHILIVPESDWPRVETFTDIDNWIGAIKGFMGSPVHLFPFIGEPVPITGPEGQRQLKTPVGMLPLFDPLQGLDDEVQHGWVGPRLRPDDTARLADDDDEPAAGTDADADEDADEDDGADDVVDTDTDELPAADDTPIFGN